MSCQREPWSRQLINTPSSSLVPMRRECVWVWECVWFSDVFQCVSDGRLYKQPIIRQCVCLLVLSWALKTCCPTRNIKTNLASQTREKGLMKACGKLKTTLVSNSLVTRWVGVFDELKRVWGSHDLIRPSVPILQVVQQQSSSETEGEGGNAADGSSEGDSASEEEEGKMKSDKVGSKRKKTASSKVPHFYLYMDFRIHVVWEQLHWSTDSMRGLDHERK